MKQDNEMDEIRRLFSKMEMIYNDIDKRMKKIEERLAANEKLVAELQTPSNTNMSFKELLDRLVFLESRLSSIEISLEESTKIRPVVLE